MDLKSLRVQLDTLELDKLQTMILANAVIALLGEVETLQQRMNDAWDTIEQANLEAHMPPECQQHECSYFAHYLAQGPADLTHEGYHQAEKQCEIAQQKSIAWYDTHQDTPPTERNPYDQMAGVWERRVRA